MEALGLTMVAKASNHRIQERHFPSWEGEAPAEPQEEPLRHSRLELAGHRRPVSGRTMVGSSSIQDACWRKLVAHLPCVTHRWA